MPPEGLKTRIDELERAIRDSDDSLQSKVYRCVANVCSYLNAYRQEGGAPGWSEIVEGNDGQPALSMKDRQTLEESFDRAKDG